MSEQFEPKKKGLSEVILSGIFATVLALGFQYYFSKDQQRKQNTQDFIAIFHSSVYSNHRDRILEFSLRPSVIFLIANRNNFSDIEYAQNIVYAVRERRDIFVSFVAVSDFLKDVKLCVETKLCDEQIAKIAFRSYAKELYEAYFPVILDMACNLGMHDAEDILLFFTLSVAPNSLTCQALAAIEAEGTER